MSFRNPACVCTGFFVGISSLFIEIISDFLDTISQFVDLVSLFVYIVPLCGDTISVFCRYYFHFSFDLGMFISFCRNLFVHILFLPL